MCFHISQHILTKVKFNKMTIYIYIKVIGGLILECLSHESSVVSVFWDFLKYVFSLKWGAEFGGLREVIVCSEETS